LTGEHCSKSLEDLASVFKALANPTRLKILALCSPREVSSRELRDVLGISKPLLIAHLRILLRAGLLTYRVEVDEVRGVLRKYYRTADFRICVSKEYLSRFCKEG
jgi:ArsR family transcriptional regulator